MTAFNRFQIATCQISAGDYAAAVATLDKALAAIDRTGKDADLRSDLASLRANVAVKCAS